MSDDNRRTELTAAHLIAGRDLTGMESIVTGGYAGLGYETAKALAVAGARVVLAGRATPCEANKPSPRCASPPVTIELCSGVSTSPT